MNDQNPHPNPNPLVPQGSIFEQKSKNRPHLKIAVFIVTIHVVFLGGLLMQGCKREQPPVTASLALTNEPALPPLDINITGAAFAPDTNLSPLGLPPAFPPAPGLPGSPGASPMAGLQPPAALAGGAENPALPPAGTDAQPAATSHYVIKKGDSFGSIAKANKISVKAITGANPGVDPVKLKIGQKINLPIAAAPDPAGAGGITDSVPAAAGTPLVYEVKAGDTLTKVGKAHGTTVKAIRTLNKMKTDRITVGQKLKVPAKTGPAMSLEGAPGGGLAAPVEASSPVPGLGGLPLPASAAALNPAGAQPADAGLPPLPAPQR